jgi:hypothetical protein
VEQSARTWRMVRRCATQGSATSSVRARPTRALMRTAP